MSGLLDTHQTSGQRSARVMAPSRRAMQELPETHIGTLSPRGDRYGWAFLPACLGDGPHLGAAGAMDPGRNAARGRDDRHRPPRDPTQCLGHRDRHRRIGPWRLRSALPPLGPPGRYGRWARPRAPRRGSGPGKPATPHARSSGTGQGAGTRAASAGRLVRPGRDSARVVGTTRRCGRPGPRDQRLRRKCRWHGSAGQEAQPTRPRRATWRAAWTGSSAHRGTRRHSIDGRCADRSQPARPVSLAGELGR